MPRTKQPKPAVRRKAPVKPESQSRTDAMRAAIEPMAKFYDNEHKYQLTHPDHRYEIGVSGYEFCLAAMKLHWAASGQRSFVSGLKWIRHIQPPAGQLPGGAPVELFISELIQAYQKDGPSSEKLKPTAIVQRAKELENEFDYMFRHARSWLKRYPKEVLAESLAPETEE